MRTQMPLTDDQRSGIVGATALRRNSDVRLRGLLLAVSGRYVDRATGRGYVRKELYAELPPSMLEREIEMEKRGQGVYAVKVKGTQSMTFDLYSRRRRPRGARE